MAGSGRIKPTESPQDDAAFRRLRQMVDMAGVGLFETTVDGTYRFVNLALVRMLGYDTALQMLSEGRPSGSFYADEKDRDRFVRSIAKHDVVSGFLSKAKRRDGTIFWVSEYATALHAPDGTITGYVGSISDVTELVETQDMLAQAEADYRRIFERVTVGIYRSSLEGRQLRSNPALVRLNGYESEEEHLLGVTDIATEWYVEPTRRAEFQRLLAEYGNVENFESEIYRHKTRERIWITENAYLVRDRSGEPLFYEGTVQEITARKKSEQEMRAAMEAAENANRSKSRFLANMSHELRTPLNSIIGFTELIQMEPHGPIGAPTYREYLGDVRKSAIMLLQLIDDILDIAKLDAGKLEIGREILSVEEVIQDTVTILAQKANAAGLTVLQEIGPDIPPLIGDGRRVRQVLANLHSNAIKYTDPGGTITLSARHESPWIILEVRDTGVGIPDGDLSKVFLPFEQSSYAIGKAKDGTGLGLPLTRELMVQHGGDITLESQVGVGTTVTVRFPVMPEE